MKRFVAFVLGIAAGLALLRVLRRRRTTAPEPGAFDPRAEELARKLAGTRSAGASAPAAEAALPEPEAPRPSIDAEIDDARRRVHEEARVTAEEMRRSNED